MLKKIIILMTAIAVYVHASVPMAVYADQGRFQEYTVKAAFVYNFAKFVEWPFVAFETPESPLYLCILGDNPFGDALESIKGKVVQERELHIRHLSEIEDIEECHILFISASERKRLSSIQQKIKNQHILSVADMEGFARHGGIIGLVKDKNRIRLEINADAADRSLIKISSKLLSLAKIIRDREQEEKH
jgi:hypothetical protein